MTTSPRLRRLARRGLLFGVLATLLLPLFASARRRSGDASGMVLRAGAVASAPHRSAVGRARVAAPAATLSTRADDSTSLDERWQHVQSEMAGTYLRDVVVGGRSRLKRWSDRVDPPLRVWIAPVDSIPGGAPEFESVVQEAFLEWEATGIPMRFLFVDSPDDAEVSVTWTERLDRQRAGVIHWKADRHGWLTRVGIELAMWTSDGGAADSASIRRIALHEIGHLLGLEHSADASDVMAAWVNAGGLTDRDRATVRLLYTLPPGDVRSELLSASR